MVRGPNQDIPCFKFALTVIDLHALAVYVANTLKNSDNLDIVFLFEGENFNSPSLIVFTD